MAPNFLINLSQSSGIMSKQLSSCRATSQMRTLALNSLSTWLVGLESCIDLWHKNSTPPVYVRLCCDTWGHELEYSLNWDFYLMEVEATRKLCELVPNLVPGEPTV
jgi:hypothetical protein